VSSTPVGLTLLQFVWTGAHSPFAPAIFAYSAPLLPSFLEMAEIFAQAVVSSTSWRVRLNASPTLVVFWYRNLTSFSEESVARMMDVLLQCLHDENLEVREMAAKTLSSVLRSAQRQRILPLKDRLMRAVRRARLPARQAPGYAEALRTLHVAILGCKILSERFVRKAPDCFRWILPRIGLWRWEGAKLCPWEGQARSRRRW
jgi:proteasome activator subunit 4